MRAWGDDYAALDRLCEKLRIAEGEIGSFHGDSQETHVARRRSEMA